MKNNNSFTLQVHSKYERKFGQFHVPPNQQLYTYQREMEFLLLGNTTITNKSEHNHTQKQSNSYKLSGTR